MNYPSWDVPVIGSGWVIGGIAIFHIMISHFAVGGGFYLPMAERAARRSGNDDWMEIVKAHSRFFMILTLVFGAVTGVAIWFAIGLANPEATSTLIHNFVFGWAMEWVFFIVEITAALAYYYTWDRVDARTHQTIGWIYAGSAWASLVIINGILAFMLTPGAGWLSVAGTGNESSMFWQAFFNPTYWPSVILRTLVCLSLAGVWALITASRICGVGRPELKATVVRWSVKWLVPSFVLMPIAFIWYLAMVPEFSWNLLEIGISTIGQGTFTQVTRAALVTLMTSATILGLVYFLAWRQPCDFGRSHAVAVLFLAFAATAATEHAREMLRKPYVVGNWMYSNGVRVTEVDRFNQDGYLTRSMWPRESERTIWGAESEAAAELVAEIAPEADAAQVALVRADPATDAAPITLAETAPAPLPEIPRFMPDPATLARGDLMVRGQCFSCHTVDGYRPLRRLLAGRNRESIATLLQLLRERPDDTPYQYMPPLVGSPGEVDALVDYFDVLVNGVPETDDDGPDPVDGT